MNNKLKPASRILSLLGALLLVGALFLPIWRIDLMAPQYPEGIYMQIFADGLGGDVEIINGLNHYIGMDTIHEEDFKEFQILPYLIGGFVVLGLISFLINKRWMLNLYFILFLIFAALAMYDFWQWEYDYGHNLDPRAPIQIPDMAYQPPLIGYKKLANFDAWSFPDTGGWFFIAAGVLQLAAVFLQWRHAKRHKTGTAAAMILLMVTLSSCATGPEPLVFGTDQCYSCKMKLADSRFGAEVISRKGKVFKFDDLSCAEDFLGKEAEAKDASIFVIDYGNPGTLVPAQSAFYLTGGSLRSPMGSNMAAFSSRETLTKVEKEVQGTITGWAYGKH